ncbi:F-box protein At3g07870-like [Lycium ferocissimum]|uniref:F-box protein At3g07870-like n=1 Tax=Lycium ferocissimum TaxID=112874 RepID=UPI0028163C17|nr:F-box protein At3g07870-like [Lycium ferocissimum]
MDTQTKKRNCQADEAPSRYGFDRLPQEVVLDIASRLPITSLLQFTFDRKSCYNLSHDPELVNLHLSCAVKTDPCIIFHERSQLTRWTSIRKVGYKIDSSSQAIMLNGKMHWLTLFGMYYRHSDRLIVSFDLADEVFGEVPKVDFGVNPRIVQFQLAVLGGCLAVALISHRFNGGGLETWVMREYNVKESWVKEFKIGAYTPTNSVLQYVQPFVKVVCLLKNGKPLLEYKGGYLVSYDPQNGVFRTLRMNMKKDLRNYFPLAIHPEMLTWCEVNLSIFAW